MRLHACSYHDAIRSLRGPLTVRVVFQHSWHLYHPAGDILTVTTGGEDGPMTVRVPGPLPAIEPGESCWLDEGHLSVGVHPIRLEGARLWTGQGILESLNRTALQRELKELEALGNPHVEQWRGRLAGGMAALEDALLRRDEQDCRAAALRLLGLGPGLTPSGDDILVGLLAGLHVLGARGPLQGRSYSPPPSSSGLASGSSPVQTYRDRSVLADTAVEPMGHSERVKLGRWIALIARDRTTPLSCMLLRWAGRGVAAQPLLDVLWSLGSIEGVRGVDRLVAVGHTSGYDMLTGACLAAKTILAREGIDGVAVGGAPQRVSRLGEADAGLGGAECASGRTPRRSRHGHPAERRPAGG